ncbi:Brefeldin A sensitivity protein [Penicillium concentricum]|uniref:Brefeldin A sensitivity protein n=1 Tax=Penicillium concentricum TaxID=293559 RepID=A0A9W9USJ9_9EURO|nr:Brefeldin A sensitivity protein [Penicillium concentricum]KAJ5355928.1 Brefeldin A sensitivity protein [Penicillium concentricum]
MAHVRSNQSGSSFGSSTSQHDVQDESSKEKTSLLDSVKKTWEKLGLDRPTVLLMLKGGLPPTIAISICQSKVVAHEFTTLSYLVPIVSILGFAIMPRAKFIQMMIFDILAVGLAACFALLTMFSSVSARQHTETDPTEKYNSSASAVSAVWLFFQIWMVHTFRAKYPQLQFPVIIYAIFANVTSIYAPQMHNMTAAFAMVKKLIAAFFTGLAISTATSLFILPMTSRQVVFKQMASYIGGLRSALNAHALYYQSLERDDMFGRTETYDEGREKFGKKGKVYSPEAEAIRGAVRQITDIHAKLHGDLTFAKREIALGKLGPDDIQAIFRHLRQIMIPVVGLSFVVDIFQRMSDYNRWNRPIDLNEPVVPEDIRQRVVHEWNDIMRAVHDPFATMIQTIDEALLHTSYVFRLTKPPKRKGAAKSSGDNSTGEGNDVEARAENTAPGQKAFIEHYEKKLGEFRIAKRLALQTWAEEKGVTLPADFFDHPTSPEILNSDFLDTSATEQERSRRQLYLFLYMEQLLHSTGHTVLNFVRYADHVEAKGKLLKTRLVIPGSKRVWKWAKSFLSAVDTDDDNMGDIHTQNNILQLGEAYKLRKDPEHLPPTTLFERIGDKIRVIPWFLRSFESTYGFRVACATMTVAIIGFLHQTQVFFTAQRLVWAMIMINMSMSPTSGQSIFSFVLRIFGTFLAMVASLLMWYIPGERTPGIIVFLFIFVSIASYIPIKMFRFRAVGIISIVTTSMIIGYELQVRRVGEAIATSNGQVYYPIYLLAPYRLAVVAGGIAIAFIWTFFPYPISEHSVLRQSLGASLYLLANYYSIIHETISGRMRGDEGEYLLKRTSAGRKLEKARHKVFSKQMLMLAGLRTYSGFLRWEVPVGGRFPKKQYDSIILCVENIVNYLSLLGYASDTLMYLGEGEDESDNTWMIDFRRLINTAKVTTHEVTSLLCLLSASITNRQPLPPYLKAPRPYSFTRRLQALDSDLLSLRHIAEPGFAAFAVLQISTRCIVGDMDRLLRLVKDLVGELDFSFHAVTTGESMAESRMPSRTGSRADLSEYASSRPGDRDKND